MRFHVFLQLIITQRVFSSVIDKFIQMDYRNPDLHRKCSGGDKYINRQLGFQPDHSNISRDDCLQQCLDEFNAKGCEALTFNEFNNCVTYHHCDLAQGTSNESETFILNHFPYNSRALISITCSEPELPESYKNEGTRYIRLTECEETCKNTTGCTHFRHQNERISGQSYNNECILYAGCTQTFKSSSQEPRYIVYELDEPTSAAPTTSPTKSPTVPTLSPTLSPTGLGETRGPTVSPSASPTVSPSVSPTFSPSVSPSVSPTFSPSASPSASPTFSPSASPTLSPSASPSVSPTFSPTGSPSVSPTGSPSVSPTLSPTGSPSVSPTLSPTGTPTLSPTGIPSVSPTPSPTGTPSVSPTGTPSVSPTLSPTGIPSVAPSDAPSVSPTLSPTGIPSVAPSMAPSDAPTTRSPTGAPTEDKDESLDGLDEYVIIAIVGGCGLLTAVISFYFYMRAKSSDYKTTDVGSFSNFGY